ncbi:MAG: hypothetical protein J6Y08_11180 [Clostridiales bacterium]|nr:hypothetical protein [Clostridiales bacterium]
MDWHTIGQTIPEITLRDLVVFRLPPEEAEQLVRQYNRALFNLNNDGADVSIITLKKIITDFPDWGEPSLLFGISVAQCEEYHRSISCFEHALTCGLHSQELTELAQYCLSEAKKDAEEALLTDNKNEEESPLKALSSAITRPESPMIAESENRERIHVQAPILIKAPRKPRKRRIATEKEIRDALMQSTSSNGEIPDDEIEVDFPKTPAEKMRMTVIAIAILAVMVGLFFLIKYVIVPAVARSSEKAKAGEQVEYLIDKLEANKEDPECSSILAEYNKKYSTKKKKTTESTTDPTGGEDPNQTDPDAAAAD